MARKPNLRLSRKQIDDLGNYAKQRFESLRTDNAARIKADKESWKIYERLREDRAKVDTIYDHSNLSIPIVAMVVDSMVARADDAILGTAPFFHFRPRGPSDPAKARESDAYFRFKLDKQAKTRTVLSDGLEPIHIQRAGFFKAIYDEDVDQWHDYDKRILWNVITDKPVRIVPPGSMTPIYVVENEHPFEPVVDPLTGMERMMSRVLPGFFLNLEIQEWRPSPDGLPVSNVRFKGARAVQVDYDAILIPSTVESIEDADIIEQYDKTAAWAEKMWVEREGMSFAQFKSKIQKSGAGTKTPTERNSESQENLGFDKEVNTIKVLECWFKRDILGKGKPQRFVVWIEADTFIPISWEYRGLVVPSGNTPYKAVAIGRKPNRWWGRSLVEMLADIQEYIDEQFNSQSYRNKLGANPYEGIDASALEDEEEGEGDIETFPGKKFRVKQGKTIADVFSHTQLPNLDGKTQDLIEFVIEMMQLWLGVSDLSQGDSGEISKHNTAMGIEATLRESSKLSRKWIRRIVRGYTDLLNELVYLTLDTMDDEEAYEVTERQNTFVRAMRAEEVRSIDFDVDLVMSQNNGGRKIENARAALETQQYYFDMLMRNPQMATISRELMVSILRELGFPDADALLPAYDEGGTAPPEELAAMQEAYMAEQQRQIESGGVKQDNKEMLPTR